MADPISTLGVDSDFLRAGGAMINQLGDLTRQVADQVDAVDPRSFDGPDQVSAQFHAAYAPLHELIKGIVSGVGAAARGGGTQLNFTGAGFDNAEAANVDLTGPGGTTHV